MNIWRRNRCFRVDSLGFPQLLIPAVLRNYDLENRYVPLLSAGISIRYLLSPSSRGGGGSSKWREHGKTNISEKREFSELVFNQLATV